MATRNGKNNRIRTTERVFQIIELLMEEDGLRLTEIAKHLDLSKSTTYRHLVSLEQEGYVVREDMIYYPGMRFLNIGEYVRNRKDVFQMVKPKVEKLAKETEERSEFFIEEHGHGIFVHREVGENAVHTNTRVGKTMPLHATAAGKAILAEYPRKRIKEIVERRGLKQLTKHTITNIDELMNELEHVRETSVAYNDQELIMGLRAVGVPIHDRNKEVVGGLSITGPTSRLRDDVFNDEFPNLLLGVANELELNLTYSNTW